MSHFKRFFTGMLMAGALLLAGSRAFAQNANANPNANENVARPHLPNNSRSVPEIDPVAIGAVASVLVGGTLLIGARRRRRAPRA